MRFCRLFGLLVSLVSVSVGASAWWAPGASGAPAGWTVQPTPAMGGPSHSLLNGVSCFGRFAQCVAVGWHENAARHVVPLAEDLENGVSQQEAALAPVGHETSLLISVSCVASGTCFAVGGEWPGLSDRGAGEPLVERRAPTGSWAVVAVPAPPSGGGLVAISCASASDCVAVGKGYSEAWNGTSWRLVAASTLAGGTPKTASGISCPSTSGCIAVRGEAAARWNGSTWAALPGLGSRQSADAIACVSLARCTAVGNNAYQWNGTTWTEQRTPRPVSGVLSTWMGVACTTSGKCVAVGYYQPNFFDFASADVFAGGKWTAANIPDVDSNGGFFQAASCDGGQCVEVGGRPIGSQEDPAGQIPFATTGPPGPLSATPVVVPPGPGTPTFRGVSCPNANWCLLVGRNVGARDGVDGVAELFSNGQWVATQDPPNEVASVSCTSDTNCEAVGGTEAASWHGGSWTAQPLPLPASNHAFLPVLASVSCTAPNACQAVGSYTNTKQKQFDLAPFTEGWNGKVWILEHIGIGPTNRNVELGRVSCASPRNCTAVGSVNGTGPTVPLVEHWNGVTWTEVRVPHPSQHNAALSGISCPLATSCMAVGAAGLAESWNGTSWSIVPTANHGQLRGVSCPSPASCTAVGAANGAPLAEHWNGHRWSVQPTPAPAKGQLVAVGCATKRTCEAIGGPGGFAEGY